MEYYFETNDKLDRKRYADFLKSMLENCDKYRREDSDGAYVIAIDSPWGTGKTRFAKMLRNYLENRTKEMKDDSLPGKNAAFNAIYYNSWETDFSDDALLPLVHSILESPEMELKRFDSEGKKTLKKFKKVATDVAKIAGYTILHNVCGETVTQMAKAAEAAATETTPDPLKRYKERLSVLNDFRNDLQDVIAQTRQKKLVIIIDELDRCRPTFAIQTLEIAKHLFNVNGLFFIFALDIKQLSCSIQTVYGQDMDAPGYLCRFFDYIGRIPEPNEFTYIENLFASCSCFEDYPCEIKQEELVKIFSDAVSCYHLSLRDISTIFQAYKLMYINFLSKYKKSAAHNNYICLLVIKYKDTELFNRICKDKTAAIIDHGEIFKSQEQKNILTTCNNLINMLHVRNIKDFDFVYLTDGKTKSDGLIKLVDVENLMLNGQLKVTYSFRASNGIARNEFYFKIRDTLSDVVFFPDLQQWSILNGLGLMQYYYQQLEMFNFALPADEPVSKA